MLEHAIDKDGDLSLITRPVTVQGVQITRRGLDARSAQWKAELGIYEVIRETVPEGYRAGSWALTLTDGVVTATPEDLQPIPPEQYDVEIGDLVSELRAAAALPSPDPEAGPVVGKTYLEGDEITVDGQLYAVTRRFTWHSPDWTPASLAAHLQMADSGGDNDEWVEGGTYAVGDLRTFDGVLYRCIAPHTAHIGAGWTPPATPSLWEIA